MLFERDTPARMWQSQIMVGQRANSLSGLERGLGQDGVDELHRKGAVRVGIGHSSVQVQEHEGRWRECVSR